MSDELGVNQQPGDPQQSQPGGQQPDPQAQYAYTQQPAADQQAPYAYAQQQAQYGYAQQQAPYGYAQQPPYGYFQQQAYMAPPRPAESQHGRGGGWIAFLRVFLWIWFALLCLTGIFVCVACFAQADVVSRSYFYTGSPEELMLAGIGSLVVCVLLAFVSVAGGMVALDAAANIRRTATNSARILELLQKKDK